jgi:hypothetical protein
MPIKGSNLNLFIQIDNQYEKVCFSQNCVLEFTADLIETTTKDGSRAKRYEYGGYGWVLRLSGISDLSGSVTFLTLQQALVNGGKLLFVFGDAVNESVYYSGTVLVSSASLDTAYNALSTFSNDLVGDGEFTTIQDGQTVDTSYNGIWDDDGEHNVVYQDI